MAWDTVKKQAKIASLAIGVAGLPAWAQLGMGWKTYAFEKKIHLNGVGDAMTFDWKPYESNCSPICADYRYDSATNTETFRLLDDRSNRSEIRLFNEYRIGSRQFEGWVTFYPPLNDESFMQVFGSSSGATQLMLRGFSAKGGSINAQGVDLATDVYGREVRINVIHEQEDGGNRFRIYVDGVLKSEFRDNERVTNYHKYGCYGSLRTPEAVVKWRNVRHFEGGAPPSGASGVGQGFTHRQGGAWRGGSATETETRIFDLNGVRLGSGGRFVRVPARKVVVLIP